ncbi:MAG: c-type cytochrome [Myxococcota bacterium]
MAGKLVKGGLGVAGVLLLVGGGAFAWGTSAAGAVTSKVYETHRVDLPVPWPLDEAAVTELRGAAATTATEASAPTDPAATAAPADPLASVDLVALANERAVARGKHLLESRYACAECHGTNLGGGTMIDDPAIGAFLGPNLTSGKGGILADYTMADWDRAVRHGVRRDGTPLVMPSQDFVGMADQELSDIVAYLRSVPPVDNAVPAVTIGPVGTMLLATAKMVPSAEQHPDHDAAHPELPPATAANAEFGSHLAKVCTGCHRADLSGGPVIGGDPSWPAARNLTTHEQGLKGWTYEQFVVALEEAKRPDGTPIQKPMSDIAPYAKNMSDTELQALWAYISALPPVPTGS